MEEILQCYALLGIQHTATPEEVKKAYRNMVKIWHPDRYINNLALKAKAEVEIKKINQAYATIKAYHTNSIAQVVKPNKGYPSSKVSKPTSPESFYQQGVAYAEQGDDRAALDSFAQAIKRDGDYLEAYQYRGFILSKLGYKLRADAEFKKAHQLKIKKSYKKETQVKTEARTASPTIKTQLKTEAQTASPTIKIQLKTEARTASPTIKTQISQPLKCERTIMANDRSIDCIAYSSWYQNFAIASGDCRIRLWQLNSGQRIGTLDGHTDRVTCLVMSPSGKTLISGSQDKTIKFWDLGKKKVIRTLAGFFNGHFNSVIALAISPDNQTLLSCDTDNSLKVWDLNRVQEVHNISFSAAITCLAFSPNGQLFCSGGLEPQIRIREVKTRQVVRSLNNTSAVLSLAFSPNGKLLATGGFDGQIKLWDLATAKIVHTLEGHSDRISQVMFSHDGRTLISASWDRTIKWHLESGKQIANAIHSDRINTIALTSDERILISGSKDRTIRLWRCCLKK